MNLARSIPNCPIRLSEHYHQPSKVANFLWPETPSYTNHISGVMQKNNQTRFNFITSDGTRSNLPAMITLDRKMIPMDRVTSVVIYHLGSNLKGLVFLDSQKESVAKCGSTLNDLT